MKSLYSKLLRDGLLNTKKEILGSVEVRSKKENIPLKIVFVRNRNDIVYRHYLNGRRNHQNLRQTLEHRGFFLQPETVSQA